MYEHDVASKAMRLAGADQAAAKVARCGVPRHRSRNDGVTARATKRRAESVSPAERVSGVLQEPGSWRCDMGLVLHR